MATAERVKKCVLERGTADPAERPFVSKIVDFSPDVANQVHKLQRLLRDTVYTSAHVTRADIKARLYIQSVFRAYLEQPARMPDYVYRKYNDARTSRQSEELRRTNLERRQVEIIRDPIFVRIIADHIAGMTDYYLLTEYRQLFTPDAW